MTADQAYAMAFDILASKPTRYAAERKSVKLRLYSFRDGEEVGSVPIGEHEDWEGFAKEAAEQGGELQRLATMGHTDEYRTADAIVALRGQLMRWDVPEKYKGIAETIRGAVDEKGVEGLMVSGEDDIEVQL